MERRRTMSIAVHKEFRLGYKEDPEIVYNIYGIRGTIPEVTENEAKFLYEALGELINEKNMKE